MDTRPEDCRFRQKDEGRAYPRSGCFSCGKTLITGLGRECTVAATPEPVAPTPSQEPDRSRMYKVGDQWWPYPHGMTEEEWNRKIAALWSKLTICDDVYHRRSVIAAIVDFGYRQKEIAAVILL